MSDYRAKRPRRDILEELRQQGRFPEFILLVWGIVELGSNEGILRAYGFSSQDPKSNPLLEMSVGRKLKVLNELGYLSAEEHQIVRRFKEKRNCLFHSDALFVPNLTQPQKDEVMDLGMVAADVMHSLRERLFKH